jgi:2-oxo-3-hexenedioate decarboxylase
MYSDFSLAAGYAVARLLDEEMLAGGAMRVGKKLGFTNQEVWSHMGLDTPFWSPMYDTTVTEAPSVSLAGLVQPRIEPEIILGFSADLPAGAPAAEIGAAIGWAAVGSRTGISAVKSIFSGPTGFVVANTLPIGAPGFYVATVAIAHGVRA